MPPLPPEVSQAQRRVARGFALLLGLRWITDPDEPIPFAGEFADAWCEVGRGEALKARQALKKGV